MNQRVAIYDTTLRDGSQREGISFSVADKLHITRLLDELGIDYIEGGWPGSNPKDVAYFEQARELDLRHAKISAFGSTRRKGIPPADDANIRALVDAAHARCHRRRQDIHAARHRCPADDRQRESQDD